jgi:hypothetical protein
MKERGERQKPGEASAGNSRTKQPLTTPKLSDLGITKSQSSRWTPISDRAKRGSTSPPKH